LKVDDIVFSGWAAASSVLTATEKELGVMLLDIGGGTTSITTYVEDAITYSGSVPFGGINITSDLAIGLRVSLEDAEKIKINAEELFEGRPKGGGRPVENMPPALDSPDKKSKEEPKTEDKKDEGKGKDIIDVSELQIEGVKTISRKMFTQIVEARLAEIFDLVASQIKQSRNEARLPAGVVITGGTALAPEVIKIAKKSFGMPARVGRPKGLEGLVDEITGPAYSVAQGLVIYGLNDTVAANISRPTSGSSSSSGKSEGTGTRITNFIKNFLP
jgi:cell division protein FtsA